MPFGLRSLLPPGRKYLQNYLHLPNFGPSEPHPLQESGTSACLSWNKPETGLWQVTAPLPSFQAGQRRPLIGGLGGTKK